MHTASGLRGLATLAVAALPVAAAAHHSRAEFEQQGESLVGTSRISAPAFDALGTLQTEAITLIETFALSADQSRLHHELIIDDAMVFSEPARHTRVWVPSASR